MLPPQTQDGVVGGGAASMIMEQKPPSSVLERIFETAKVASVSRKMLQARLLELDAQMKACAANKQFIEAAKMRDEKFQTEEALHNVDLARAEQEAAVEEHLAVLISKEQFEEAAALQQAWDADKARFEQEPSAPQSVQASPSANPASQASSSGPAPAIQVAPTAHAAPAIPANSPQMGNSSSPGTLETPAHIAFPGN